MEEPRLNLPDYFGDLDMRTIDNPLYTGPSDKTRGLPSYDELDECNKEED